MIKYLLLLNFSLWASCTGFVEAILFSGKASAAFKWNEHIVLVLQRVLVLSMVVLVYFTADQYNIWIMAAGCILSFSFWHNGFYYVSRNKIDVPVYNFFSESKTSTAWLEVSFYGRLFLFLAGLVTIYFA